MTTQANEQATQKPQKQFEISPNGDPYQGGWEVREKDEKHGFFYRGDISPLPMGKRRAIAWLKARYPGCKVKVCDR